jgi:hypothetical protein
MPLIARMASPFFEIALVLVRFDHVARFIVNANHRIMSGLGDSEYRTFTYTYIRRVPDCQRVGR